MAPGALILFLGMALGLGAPGCASGERVTFTVTRAGDGAPVPAARVRAAPIGLSPMPVPLGLETLEEAEAAPGDAGFTDAQGHVTLSLSGRRYLVEVSDSPLMNDTSIWTWVWDGRRRALGPGTEGVPVHLDVLRR